MLRSVELAVIRVAQENGRAAAFPDPHSLARDELTSLLQELTSREEVVSDEGGCCTPRSTLCAGSLSTGFAMRATWSSLALTFSTPARRASASRATRALRTFRTARATRPRHWARRATTARSVEWVEARRSLLLSRREGYAALAAPPLPGSPEGGAANDAFAADDAPGGSWIKKPAVSVNFLSRDERVWADVGHQRRGLPRCDVSGRAALPVAGRLLFALSGATELSLRFSSS